MALDLVSFQDILKEHYEDLRVKNMVYQDNPLLAMVSKMENFGGRNLPIPIQFGTPQSRSATYATALAAKAAASSQYDRYELTRVRDYCLATIDNETMEASKGDINAFMEATISEINSAIHSCTRSLAVALYRSGTGSIGTVGAFPVITVLQLANIEDVSNFEVGMELVSSDVAGGDGGALQVGTATVTAIDRNLGQLTTDAGGWVAQIALASAGDFLYQEGDHLIAADRLKVSGLQAWLPTAAEFAPATPFFGVLREQDQSRLAGVQYDGTAETVEEAGIGASARLAREGGRPTHWFMNHHHYAQLLRTLGSKKEYVDNPASDVADISFPGVRLHTPSGTVNVVPDHNCPTGTSYLLKLDTWKLYSIGMAPKILEPDGKMFLREPSLDAIEVRVGYYGQLGCSAPGFNCRVALAI